MIATYAGFVIFHAMLLAAAVHNIRAALNQRGGV